MQTKELKCFSLFTGAGALDIGLEKAGFEVVVACEYDRHAVATLHANRPALPVLGDIFSVNGGDLRSVSGVGDGVVHLMAGGPPCQSWSMAGRREGIESRNGVAMLKYLDLVREVKPLAVLIENVEGMLSMDVDGVPVVDMICGRLHEMRYGTNWGVLNSVAYGVPQARRRVIILGGIGNRKIPLPQPTHGEDTLFDGLSPFLTLGDVLRDLPKEGDSHTKFSPRMARYMSYIPEGGNWRDMPLDVQKEAMRKSFDDTRGGRSSYYRRLTFSKPCPTLMCCPTGWKTTLCHPVENRPLSIAEYKRVQQFPDDWKLCGPISSQYRQVGNAVPVGLAEAVGRELAAFCAIR